MINIEENILFQDDYFIAINKPCNLLVHRTSKDDSDVVFALQLVRNWLGKAVFPVHRLDRPTSGILIFALSSKAAARMGWMFTNKEVQKKYVALVREWPEAPHTFINYPVYNIKGKLLEARTDVHLIQEYILPETRNTYLSTQYATVAIYPMTGRWHQIRQHLAYLQHHIINDRVHGSSCHNHFFTNHLGIADLFLHAQQMSFVHPFTGLSVELNAPFPEHWEIMNRALSPHSSRALSQYPSRTLSPHPSRALSHTAIDT